MKDYLSLKEDELLRGAKLIFLNAKLHFNVVQTLNKQGNNFRGFSNTHLIACIEELTKSVLLSLRAKDRTFMDSKAFNSLFKNHNLKHESYYKIILSVYNEILNEIDEKAKLVYGLGFLGYVTLKAIGIDTEPIDNSFKSDALEKYRLRGFYVDFDENSNKWVQPKEQTLLVIGLPVVFSTIKFIENNFIKEYNEIIGKELRNNLKNKFQVK